MMAQPVLGNTKDTYRYPKNHSVRSIRTQENRLRELFPQLGKANLEVAEADLPQGAEGWFAIPCWEKLAKNYVSAVREQVMPALAKEMKGFRNYLDGTYGPTLTVPHLRQNQESIEAYQTLKKHQESPDILLVPAQFGCVYRGCPVEEARQRFQPEEFGLGILAVAAMLLTHPNRLLDWNQLQIDCGGDEYRRTSNGKWEEAPIFLAKDNQTHFNARLVSLRNNKFGTATGFVV